MLNLLACLLDAGRPLTRSELVRDIAGYPEGAAACRRSFERDKDSLRSMGVPLETEATPDGDTGYRVRPEHYYLPDLALDDEETAALRVAVSAIGLGDPAGEGALLKVGGLTGDPVPPIVSLPFAPALASLFDAFHHRAVVEFTHRGLRRRMEPWALVSKWGRWYVVGLDHDRDGVRAFRADRIDPEVEVGEPEAFIVPAGFSPDEHLPEEPWLFGPAEPIAVSLLVDADHVSGCAMRVGEDALIERRTNGDGVFEVLVSDLAAFRTFVLGFLDHAEVIAPDSVRADIIAWLVAMERQEGSGKHDR